MTIDQIKNHPIKSPKTKKKPENHAKESIIPPRKSPTTFARFWRIFIGAAEALASICERFFLSAYAILYVSRKFATAKLIQIEYQIELISARMRTIKIFLSPAKKAITIRELDERKSQKSDNL